MAPAASTAPARLFYDPGCGPCSFFARVSAWACRSQLRIVPYDGEEALRTLSDMSEDARISYAHFVDQHGRRSGSAIMSPLVALAGGTAGGQVVERIPPVDRGLRWLYDRFWNYRRTHGCAAPVPLVVS